MIPRTRGGYVVGHNHNISNLDIETGKITEVLATVHELEKNKKDTRFNDGKCDASGRLWAGNEYNNNNLFIEGKNLIGCIILFFLKTLIHKIKHKIYGNNIHTQGT